MKKITLENINMQYPFIISYDEVKNKGLGNENEINENYIKYLNKYKKLFEEFLLKKYPLKSIDDSIKNSKYVFLPIEEDNMDFYQSTSTMNLKYIYLRNNLNIEKLSLKDLKYLNECDETLNEENEKFILNTFKDVIDPCKKEEKVRNIIFYGPENRNYICDSTDLVFGIRYDELSSSNLRDINWKEEFINKNNILNEIVNIIENDLVKDNNIKVRCIIYNQFSVDFKKNNESIKK